MIPVDPASKRVILCVDDDPAIRHYEKTLLERSGYAVLTASSAQQGLKLVTMCEFDIVLLDYAMLGMTGYEVAMEMKRMTPELMVILLSGGDVPIQGLAFVDGFIFKLDASRELLPMIAALGNRIRRPQRKQEGDGE